MLTDLLSWGNLHLSDPIVALRILFNASRVGGMILVESAGVGDAMRDSEGATSIREGAWRDAIVAGRTGLCRRRPRCRGCCGRWGSSGFAHAMTTRPIECMRTRRRRSKCQSAELVCRCRISHRTVSGTGAGLHASHPVGCVPVGRSSRTLCANPLREPQNLQQTCHDRRRQCWRRRRAAPLSSRRRPRLFLPTSPRHRGAFAERWVLDAAPRSPGMALQDGRTHTGGINILCAVPL